VNFFDPIVIFFCYIFGITNRDFTVIIENGKCLSFTVAG